MFWFWHWILKCFKNFIYSFENFFIVLVMVCTNINKTWFFLNALKLIPPPKNLTKIFSFYLWMGVVYCDNKCILFEKILSVVFNCWHRCRNLGLYDWGRWFNLTFICEWELYIVVTLRQFFMKKYTHIIHFALLAIWIPLIVKSIIDFNYLQIITSVGFSLYSIGFLITHFKK